MITITKGFDWTSGATATPARLNLSQTGLVINCAANKLLGRTTGDGAIEEIPCTATARSLLAASDAAAMRLVLDLDNLYDGNGDFDIVAADQLKLNVEGGYPVSGAIQLGFDADANVYIGLAGSATFTGAGMAAGQGMRLVLKNTTGGSITLGWPAWTQPVGTTLPTSLAAGATLVLNLYVYGTTTASVVATLA